MTATGSRRIAIVGAGPGGLTCARVLQRHGVAVTVHDVDPHEHARDQGGSLDLHEADGQRALREAGLLDEFFALARLEGQEMRQLDPRTAALLVRRLPEPGESSAPEIERGRLRRLLLESLEPGTVRWGDKLREVTGPDDGPRTLVFEGGPAVEADLVVGADGAWSRVRRAVSRATPSYSGVDFLEAWFDDVEVDHPELVAMVGAGSAMAHDVDGALFAQRGEGGRMRVYIVRRRPVDWLERQGLSLSDTAGVRAHLLEEFRGWDPHVLRLITDNDGPYIDRPLHVLPAPHRWRHCPTVTLLGDAAHLMPPAGVGVNLAMLDGCELALAVAGEPDVGQAVRRYESVMSARSEELAVALQGHADFLLDDGETPDFDKPPTTNEPVLGDEAGRRDWR